MLWLSILLLELSWLFLFQLYVTCFCRVIYGYKVSVRYYNLTLEGFIMSVKPHKLVYILETDAVPV